MGKFKIKNLIRQLADKIMENLPQIGKNLSNAQKEAQPSKFIIYTIKAIAVIFTATPYVIFR